MKRNMQVDNPIEMIDFFPPKQPEQWKLDNPLSDELMRQKMAAMGISEEFLNGSLDSYARPDFTTAAERFKEYARVKQKQMLDSLKRVAIVSSHRRGVNVHTIYPHKTVTKFRSRRYAKMWVKEFRASIK